MAKNSKIVPPVLDETASESAQTSALKKEAEPSHYLLTAAPDVKHVICLPSKLYLYPARGKGQPNPLKITAKQYAAIKDDVGFKKLIAPRVREAANRKPMVVVNPLA